MRSVSSIALIAKVFAINVVLLVLSACSENQASETEQDYIQTAIVEQIDRQPSYKINRQYIGEVSAKQQTNLAFEFSGRILETIKDAGDVVKSGNIIAVQDAELLNIRANELRAQIKQVEAKIVLNQANLSRAKKLYLSNYASEQRIDELNAEHSILTANLNGLKASFDALHYQISKATLRAPYDGVINQRFIAQGDMILAGKKAFTLINQNQSEITLGVPAHISKKLKLSQALDVIIDKISYQAVILAIGQQIEPTTRTVSVRLKLNNNYNGSSGSLAKVFIEQEQMEEGYWVPLTALIDGVRGQWNIYSVAKEGPHYTIIADTINLLHTTKNKAYISGLNSKSINIITTGLHRYVPGQQVKVKGASL